MAGRVYERECVREGRHEKRRGGGGSARGHDENHCIGAGAQQGVAPVCGGEAQGGGSCVCAVSTRAVHDTARSGGTQPEVHQRSRPLQVYTGLGLRKTAMCFVTLSSRHECTNPYKLMSRTYKSCDILENC